VNQPSVAEIDRLNILSKLSAGKRTEKDTQEMVRLEREAEEYASLAFAQIVEQVVSELPMDGFDYNGREKQAHDRASVELPGLAREAQRRAATFESAYDRLLDSWKGMSVMGTEWKVDAGAASLLYTLRKERDRAKIHARYCTACFDAVDRTLLALKWMLENWDRYHLQQPKTVNDGVV